jgi:N-acetylmuramoyl-L-alanine amidase
MRAASLQSSLRAVFLAAAAVLSASSVSPAQDTTKFLVVLDLGHNARYIEGGCLLDGGAVRRDVTEVYVIDHLARRLIVMLKDNPEFAVALTREPGSELPGGCMLRTDSLKSRFKIGEDAYAHGRQALFVSLHINGGGYNGFNRLKVFVSKQREQSRQLGRLVVQGAMTGARNLHATTEQLSKNLRVLEDEQQRIPAVIIEMSDITYGKRLLASSFLEQKANLIAVGIRHAVQNMKEGQKPVWRATPSISIAKESHFPQ